MSLLGFVSLCQFAFLPLTRCRLAKPPSDTLPTMRLFANWQKIASSQVTAVDILSVCKRCRSISIEE